MTPALPALELTLLKWECLQVILVAIIMIVCGQPEWQS